MSSLSAHYPFLCPPCGATENPPTFWFITWHHETFIEIMTEVYRMWFYFNVDLICRHTTCSSLHHLIKNNLVIRYSYSHRKKVKYFKPFLVLIWIILAFTVTVKYSNIFEHINCWLLNSDSQPEQRPQRCDERWQNTSVTLEVKEHQSKGSRDGDV